MNKYLKLPVKFINEEGSKKMNELETLGLEYDEDDYAYDDYLYVNSDSIISFNKDSAGNVNLILANGVSHMVFMRFDEFCKVVEEQN